MTFRTITSYFKADKLRVLTFAVAVSLIASFTQPDIWASPKGKSRTTAVSSGTSKQKSSGKKNSTKSTGKKNTGTTRNNKGKGSGKNTGKKETSAELKKRQAATQEEIARTRRQIKENEAQVKKNLVELGRLGADITAGKAKVDKATSQVNALSNRIDTLESKIATDEKELASLRGEYLKTVKNMQKKRNDKSLLAFIFSSSDFSQAMRRIRYVKEFSAWREKQTAKISNRVAALAKQRSELSGVKNMQEQALDRQVKAQKELETQYGKQDALVVQLKQNGTALQAHLAKKQAEVNTLRNKVASLIAEETRRAEAEAKRAEQERIERERAAKREEERKQQLAEQQKRQAEENRVQKNAETPDKKDNAKVEDKKEVKPKKDQKTKEQKPQKDSKTKKETTSKKETERKQPSKPEPKPDKKKTEEVSYAEARQRQPRGNGASFEAMRGSLPRPVAGSFRITSPFGRNSLPDMPSVTFDNPGIDAEVSNGASAQAVFGGKVAGVYVVSGYSTVVILNHGAYYTVYGNLSSASVKTGDTIKQGQVLGKVGRDEEDPDRSIIHFEVWKNREKLNPQSWIK
ncbi:MAG: peptidoglycan DD-metalloendopeptidase family protein [Muribaculaceae bacterium]|nr:peptidoglycan DD-metalloendopeptidase family protein [Muribaculaceae bacterium]